MPNVPYSYEVNVKLVTENGSLTTICSLSNRSLSSSLTLVLFKAGGMSVVGLDLEGLSMSRRTISLHLKTSTVAPSFKVFNPKDIEKTSKSR